MPFKPDELIVGMTSYFTISQANRHEDIHCWRPTSDKKVRPFLCFAQDDDDGGDTYWVALTTVEQRQRLRIQQRWLRYARGRFEGAPLYVCDLRDVYVGPAAAFSDLSQKHDRANGYFGRVYLTPEGVDAVHEQVAIAGGMCPEPNVRTGRVMRPRMGPGVRTRMCTLRAA